MVKKLILPLTVLSVTGLSAFSATSSAQDGVAKVYQAGSQLGYYNSNYYVASPRLHEHPQPNPTYWTRLPCPLHRNDPCDACQQHGIWTKPAVRWVLDPNYYTVAPDYGWSEPGKWPIVRQSPVYNKYTPDVWYGTGKAGQQVAQHYPVVATPTDTTQLGYYYQTVPQWQPNPGMLPPPPNPRQWMYRTYELNADGSYTRWVPLRDAWVPINQLGAQQIQTPAQPAVQPDPVPQPKAVDLGAPVPPPPPVVPAPVPAPEASNDPEPGGAIRKASFVQRVLGRK